MAISERQKGAKAFAHTPCPGIDWERGIALAGGEESVATGGNSRGCGWVESLGLRVRPRACLLLDAVTQQATVRNACLSSGLVSLLRKHFSIVYDLPIEYYNI